MKLAFIVPTFREEHHVRCWINIMRSSNNDGMWHLFIVNGNPDDESSRLIREAEQNQLVIKEVKGCPEYFWASLVRLGLQTVLNNDADWDWLIVANVDIRFDKISLEKLLYQTESRSWVQTPLQIRSDGYCTSCGVRVRSWWFSLNEHFHEGLRPASILDHSRMDADFLPTRFLLLSPEIVKKVGLPNAKALPHYGADYEWTYRMKKAGYRLLVNPVTTVTVDDRNTGYKSFHGATSFRQRLGWLFSIKSTLNIKYRTRFVLLTHPIYCWPTALLSNWMKILLEVLLGGLIHRRRRTNGSL